MEERINALEERVETLEDICMKQFGVIKSLCKDLDETNDFLIDHCKQDLKVLNLLAEYVKRLRRQIEKNEGDA